MIDYDRTTNLRVEDNHILNLFLNALGWLYAAGWVEIGELWSTFKESLIETLLSGFILWSSVKVLSVTKWEID